MGSTTRETQIEKAQMIIAEALRNDLYYHNLQTLEGRKQLKLLLVENQSKINLLK
jgi:hypothetical protein